MVFNCVIVDDEPLAIKVIETHLKEFDDFKLVASCRNASQAFSVLNKKKVDVLFLDIEMPKLDGLTFLKTLDKPPAVILTTAHRDFAIEGFELDVVDYLLKPISLDRMMQAVGKLRRMGDKQKSGRSEEIYKAEFSPFIYVKSDRENIKINLKDIQYIESLKNHVKVVTEGKNYITLISIGQMEQKLPADMFLRVHRSYLVNLYHIANYTHTYVTIGRKSIPLGKIYKEDVLHKLGENQL